MPNKFFDIVPPKLKGKVGLGPSSSKILPKKQDKNLIFDKISDKISSRISDSAVSGISKEEKPLVFLEEDKKIPQDPDGFAIEDPRRLCRRDVEKVEIPAETIETPVKTKRKLKIIITLILILVFLASLAIVSVLFLSKTKITISPETENLNLKDSVAVDLEPKQNEADYWVENKIIPGQIFNDTKGESRNFPATGKALIEKKAEGVIRVYNNYSTSEQLLSANTRFVSADGKLFKSIEKATIAGGKYEKGKLIPGETDVKVRAAEPGEDYNIEASTFSIPGFAGTPRYTAFYGKSSSSMTGGFKGEVLQITQDDLNKAESILVEKLKKESRDFLKTALPEDFILIDETISQEVIEKKFSEEAGKEAESFNLEAKIESKAVVFKNSDLKNFAKNLINRNILKDKKFQEESLVINTSYEIEEEIGSTSSSDAVSQESGLISQNAEKVMLSIDINVKTYPAFDLEGIRKNILGKTFEEVRLFLKDQPLIKKVEIERGPFWRRRVPENFDKVEIKIDLGY